MRTILTMHLRRAALALPLGALLALGACDDERASVFSPIGPRAIDFTASPDGTGLPAGRVDLERLQTLRDSIARVIVIDTSTDPATGSPRGDTLSIESTIFGTTDTLSGIDSSATIFVSGLRTLNGAVYQAWTMTGDPATGVGSANAAFGRVVEYFLTPSGEVDPVTGDSILVTDSTVVAASGSGTYTGSTDPDVVGAAFAIIPNDAANSVDPFTEHAVMVSLEDAAATSPSEAVFVWRRIGLGAAGSLLDSLAFDTVQVASVMTTQDTIQDTIAVTFRERFRDANSGGLTFGTFGGFDPIAMVSPQDYVYPVAGSGRGGFRGDVELAVDFRGLPRPPIGFFYRGWVMDDAGGGALVDTLRSAYSPVSSVSRVSLFDADVNPVLPGVVGDEIDASQVRNCVQGSNVDGCQNSLSLTGANPFAGLTMFRLALEPKGSSDDLGINAALGAAVPEIVSAPPEE